MNITQNRLEQKEERSMLEFDQVHRKWSLQGSLIRGAELRSIPTSHLLWSELPRIKTVEACFVTIKADGERCKVLCDLEGECFAFTSSGGMTRLSRSKKHSGVIFDAEKVIVGDSYAYLCFDIIDISFRSVPRRFSERNVLMSAIIAEMDISLLVCKPVHPVSDSMCTLTREYPFSTDGLIFMCQISKRSSKERGVKIISKCLKWKPVITIDFLLGDYPVRSSNGVIEYEIFSYRRGRNEKSDALRAEEESLTRSSKLHRGKFDHVMFSHLEFPSTIELPVSEIPRLVSRNVAELKWDGNTHSWKFIKVRRDKRRANSQEVIEELLELIKNPMSIEQAMSGRLKKAKAAEEQPSSSCLPASNSGFEGLGSLNEGTSAEIGARPREGTQAETNIPSSSGLSAELPLWLVFDFLTIPEMKKTALSSFEVYQVAEGIKIQSPVRYFEQLSEKISSRIISTTKRLIESTQPGFIATTTSRSKYFSPEALEAIFDHDEFLLEGCLIGSLMHLFCVETIQEFLDLIKGSHHYLNYVTQQQFEQMCFDNLDPSDDEYYHDDDHDYWYYQRRGD